MDNITNCNCSFCKLREIQFRHFKEQLEYLNNQKEKLKQDFQSRNLELLRLCIEKNLSTPTNKGGLTKK